MTATATATTRKPAPAYVAATVTVTAIEPGDDDWTMTGTVVRQNGLAVWVRWDRYGPERIERMSRHNPRSGVTFYTADEWATYVATPEGDDEPPYETYIEHETWRGRRVILSWQRSEIRRGLHEGVTEAPQYIVAAINHGSGTVVLADPATGRAARSGVHEHFSYLVEVDDQGHDVRGRYAEIPEAITLRTDPAVGVVVSIEARPALAGVLGATDTSLQLADGAAIALTREELAALHAAIGARLAALDER